MEQEIVRDPLVRFRKVFDEVEVPKGGLPSMPNKISAITSDELGDMLARYTAWREFTEDRHLEACAVYAQIKSEHDLEADKIMLRSTAKNVTEKKAEARVSRGVVAKSKYLLEAELYKELLAGKLESFTNVLTMLSRELTRRGVNV